MFTSFSKTWARSLDGNNQWSSTASNSCSNMRANARTLLYLLVVWVAITTSFVVYLSLFGAELDPSGKNNEFHRQLTPQVSPALGAANPTFPAPKSVHDDTKVEKNTKKAAVEQKKASKKAPKKAAPKRDATYHQPPAKYHTVFSTGCSTFQDWQSYVFFYHALQSRQEGHITRIASGCEGETKKQLEQIFQDEIAPMDPERLHLHQTFPPSYCLYCHV